jgi:carbon storage regulator
MVRPPLRIDYQCKTASEGADAFVVGVATMLQRRSRVMLILTRSAGETVMIGSNITVTVLSAKGGHVRLGISAPKDVVVHRQEVFERLLREKLDEPR